MNIPTLLSVSQSDVQKYLPQAVQLVLKGRLEGSASYSQKDKLTITKIYKNLNVICKLNMKELKQVIRLEPGYQQALADIYMDKKINNYILITNYEKPMQRQFTPVLEADTLLHPHEVTAVEYRIEFTLSNIAKKSVMKPIILLVFRFKNNQKLSVYYNLEQFSLLRQRVAASMRQVYGIQLRAL